MITNNIRLKPAALAIVLTAATLLTGCATVSTVESDVRSYSAASAPVQAGTFTFERLPSQDQDAEQAALVESMAQGALQKMGFTRVDTGARYSIQIGAESSEAAPTYSEPFYAPPYWNRPRMWFGRPFYATPWPEREVYLTRVHLEIRDLGTGKVVYESTATNEQSWFKANRVLPAMFDAVLVDFPSPPKGVRKVIVKLADAP